MTPDVVPQESKERSDVRNGRGLVDEWTHMNKRR